MIYSPVRKGITLAKQTRKSFNNSVGTAEVEVISLVIDSNAVTSIYGRKRGHRSAYKRDQQEKQRADGSLLHKKKRSR